MSAVVAAAVLLLALAVQFALSSQAQRTTSAAALAVAGGLGAAIGVLGVTGLPGRGRFRSPGVAREVLWVLSGAAAWFFAPLLVLANRYSDAPPGSEVLFLTTSAWGAALGLVLAARSRDLVTRAAGAILSLAGAAAIVANWERPSSFSLFVRFVREETLMLLAGVGLLALIVVLVRATRDGTLSGAAFAAGAGSLAAAVLGSIVFLRTGALEAPDLLETGTIAYGVATALVAAAVVLAVKTSGGRSVALAYLLAPIAVSALVIPEQLIGPLGPQPLIVMPLLGGALALVIGATALTSQPTDVADLARRMRLVAIVLSGLAVCAAILALATPALEAAVRGIRPDGSEYRAAFELWGYESAGAWIALGLAALALGSALAPPYPGGRSRAYGATLIAGSVAWYVAAGTPLRTLTRFIPSDVQVDYGSEFATITFNALDTPLQLVAIGGALLAGAVVLVSGAARDVRGPEDGSRGDHS